MTYALSQPVLDLGLILPGDQYWRRKLVHCANKFWGRQLRHLYEHFRCRDLLHVLFYLVGMVVAETLFRTSTFSALATCF